MVSFNVHENRVMCIYAWWFIFQVNDIVGFDGLYFIFLVIWSEVTVQCITVIYRQGSCTLLVHFVGFAYQGKGYCV